MMSFVCIFHRNANSLLTTFSVNTCVLQNKHTQNNFKVLTVMKVDNFTLNLACHLPIKTLSFHIRAFKSIL